MKKIGRPKIYTEDYIRNYLESFWGDGNESGWGAVKGFAHYTGISERQLRRDKATIALLRGRNLSTDREAPVKIKAPSSRGASEKTNRSSFWS